MTSKLKIENLQLHVYQMKSSNSGNLKIAMGYIVDLLVTFNDLLLSPIDLKIEIRGHQ